MPLLAQQVTQTTEENSTNTTQPSKVYYGGIVGLSFGNYFRINVAPMIGYKFVPNASVGMKVAYEYISDSRYTLDRTYHNYGASIFTRYRFIPKAYLHAEFAYMSYQYSTDVYKVDRYWVPFLLLGGGFIQPISANTALVAEILFDVLQDSQSPYEEWSPLISIGVNVGF
jgi:hypothetical protein